MSPYNCILERYRVQRSRNSISIFAATQCLPSAFVLDNVHNDRLRSKTGNEEEK